MTDAMLERIAQGMTPAAPPPVSVPAAAPERPLVLWLVCGYVVALLALPVDVGLHLGALVVTPSRVLLGLALLVAIVDWRAQLAALRAVPKPIWIGWALFLGSTLITAVLVPSTASWARYGSLVGEGVIVFALVFCAAAAPDGLRRLAMVFVTTMVLVAGIVLVLAVLGIHYDQLLSSLSGSTAARESVPRYGFVRQAGPFRAPLYFAIWLTAASALLMPTLADAARRIRLLALAGWLVLLVAIVTLTASRLAMTAMFLIPAAYFMIRGKPVIGIASLVAAVAVALGLATVVPSTPLIDASGQDRVAAINPALQAISAHPFFGWGLLSDSSVLSAIIGAKNYVDDTYLSLAVEVGLVGLLAFLVLAAAILIGTFWAWTTARGLALTIAVVAVLGMGILASVFQVTQGYAAFFVLAALAVSAAKPDGPFSDRLIVSVDTE